MVHKGNFETHAGGVKWKIEEELMHFKLNIINLSYFPPTPGHAWQHNSRGSLGCHCNTGIQGELLASTHKLVLQVWAE